MNSNLFTGQLVRLTALNAEKDAEAFARWDLDSEYLRQLDSRSTAAQSGRRKSKRPLRKCSRKIPIPSNFPCARWRTIGSSGLSRSTGLTGSTAIRLSVSVLAIRPIAATATARTRMRVMLRYGFMELNLYRVQLECVFVQRACDQVLPEDRVRRWKDASAACCCVMASRWDFVYMSVLRDEWHDNEQ